MEHELNQWEWSNGNEEEVKPRKLLRRKKRQNYATVGYGVKEQEQSKVPFRCGVWVMGGTGEIMVSYIWIKNRGN